MMATLLAEQHANAKDEIALVYHNSGLSRNDIKTHVERWATKHGIRCECTGETTGSSAAGITHTVYYRVPDPTQRTWFKLRWS